MKCLNNFVESAVIARREADENPKTSLPAENEITNKQFLLLPIYGSESTYSNKKS